MFLRKLLGEVPLHLREEANADGSTEGESGSAPGEKTVPLEKYKQTLDEMHAAKSQVKTLSDDLTKFKGELDSLKTQKSKDTGDFKTLYEQTLADKEKIQTKYDNIFTGRIEEKREEALSTELKKLGLRTGHEHLIDLADANKMPHELTTKGRILISGADVAAAELKEKYPAAFEIPKTTVNNGSGGGGGDSEVGAFTAEQVNALEDDSRKNPGDIAKRKKWLEARTVFVAQLNKKS